MYICFLLTSFAITAQYSYFKGMFLVLHFDLITRESLYTITQRSFKLYHFTIKKYNLQRNHILSNIHFII